MEADAKVTERMVEIEQMCCASSDTYSAGEWCHAANDLLAELLRLREREQELEAAIRDARPTMAETVTVTVTPGVGGLEAEDFALLLRSMYAAWNGPLDLEPGLHRVSVVSVRDEQRRVHTATCRVTVGRVSADTKVRSYDFRDGRATDHTTKITAPIARVLGGDLSAFYEDAA